MRLSPRRGLIRRVAPLAALALTTAAFGSIGSVTAAHADPAYTVQTLHFKVGTGPGGTTTCDIIGDLYQPADASSTHRYPSILTTNGFGGSKADQAGLGTYMAQHGYVVLSYSGLGFGGSSCPITLDDPTYDGVAGSQLVSYLGGAPDIAYTDAAHTAAAPPLTSVVHDPKDHDGIARTFDPRVGMIGGSYGGEIQFAVAGLDHRVDTIVPLITWNDLTYSLAPNNTNQTTGVSTANSGATKLTWGLFFSADGILNGVQNAQVDPNRLIGCPNFITFVCPALVQAGTFGYFDPASIAALRHASVASYMSRIKVPVLLMQGETDTLFNLNEAIANYRALKAQGTPVSLVFQSWGHSNSTPAPGEIDLKNPDPAAQYETGRVAAWFSHYLGNTATSTGPKFAYFRPWVSYTGNAAPAYGSSSSFPVGTPNRFFLSAGHGLTGNPLGLLPSTQVFTTVPAGAPLQFSSLDALGNFTGSPSVEADAPGTYADFNTSALTRAVDVVGSPTLTLKVFAPTAALTQGLGEAGQLVLFVRIQDVPPGGSGQDINYLTAPIRVPDVGVPFTVTLPAFVHEFPAGHQIRLVISGSSTNYRGGLNADPVTITTGTQGQVLSLPTVTSVGP